MTKIFVASPVEVYHEDTAAARLAVTNDAAYYDEGKGILSVPVERWQQAQVYERATWMEYNLGSIDDRNGEHAEKFDGYSALPADLGDMIELGCGAFTNTRLILEHRTARTVTLLDPLLDSYLSHPNCHYKDGTLAGHPVKTVAQSIEAYRTKQKFDAIVMINVLTHCQDAHKVMHWIDAHLKSGGFLVFGEHPNVMSAHDLYDVGHPLRFTEAQINEWLLGYTSVYRNGSYAIARK